MDTKRILIYAMADLLNEKNISKITIQNILDKAHVSRTTFYNYFTDKFDIMSQCLIHVLEQELKMYNGHNLKEIFITLNKTIKTNHYYYQKMLLHDENGTFEALLYQYFFDFFKHNHLLNTHSKTLTVEDRIKIQFYLAGVIFVLKEWMLTDIAKNPEFITNICFDLIPITFTEIQ